MKKVLSIMIIIAVLCFGITGCANDVATSKNKNSAVTTLPGKTFTLDQFISALKAAGLNVVNNGEYAVTFGEDKAYDLSINGVDTDVCVFKLTTKDKVAINNIKMANDKGEMKMNLQAGALPAGQSPNVKAIINGNIAVTSYDKHPDAAKIKEALKSLK